jgi:AhpC/TSA family/HEAT repeats
MSSLPQSNTPQAGQPDCRGVGKTERRKTVGATGRKPRRWLLGGGCVLVLLALIFWRPLQQEFLAYCLLHLEAPSEEALSEAVEQASAPAVLLARLWDARRVPHRQFVLSYLGRISTGNPNLIRVMEPLLVEAAADPDIEARQSALATLDRIKHPHLRRLVLEQLSDADPAVRLIGLQSLRRIATTNDVAMVMGFLKDPEPRVVVAAALVLRQATGQDFGIRSTHALPQFTCMGTNPPPAPDLATISQGVQRWHAWWNIHRDEYPEAHPAPGLGRITASLPAPNFTLEDVAGMPVHLSDFHGKAILLAFWSLDATANLDVLALQALQEHTHERLAVIGICIPAVPSCADEEGHRLEHAHGHHHDSSTAPSNPEQMRHSVQHEAGRLKISYPMLIDSTGRVGARFNVEDRPTSILIDAHGTIRRRFVGNRTEQVLEKMVQEIAPPM